MHMLPIWYEYQVRTTYTQKQVPGKRYVVRDSAERPITHEAHRLWRLRGSTIHEGYISILRLDPGSYVLPVLYWPSDLPRVRVDCQWIGYLRTPCHKASCNGGNPSKRAAPRMYISLRNRRVGGERAGYYCCSHWWLLSSARTMHFVLFVSPSKHGPKSTYCCIF